MDIPLPALNIQPVQIEDPLKKYAQMVQLRSIQQQQALNSQLAPYQIQQAKNEAALSDIGLSQKNYINSLLGVPTGQTGASPAQPPAPNASANPATPQASTQQGAPSAPSMDADAWIQKLGSNPLTAPYAESMQKIQQGQDAHRKAKQEIDSARADNLGLAAYTVKGLVQNGLPPEQAIGAVESALSGYDDPWYVEKIQRDLQMAQTKGPQGVAALLDSYISGSKKAGEFQKDVDVAKLRSAPAVARLNAELPGGPLYAPTIAGESAKQRVAVENSPEAVNAAANKAAAVARATAPIEENKAVATEVAKASALAPTLDQVTKTTSNGTKYVDLTNLNGPQATIVKQQALAAGIPLADKDTASTLTDIDTAKKNMQFMLDTVGKKLASGAPERLWYGPKNTIERLAQSDPDLAAMGTYRNAAIQTMRAVAGSKGLKINNAEIQMAIDNDIPKPSDTLPVAQAKLRNLEVFLGNHEQMLLSQNRQNPGATQEKKTAPQGATHIGIGSVDKKKHYLDANGKDLGLAE